MTYLLKHAYRKRTTLNLSMSLLLLALATNAFTQDRLPLTLKSTHEENIRKTQEHRNPLYTVEHKEKKKPYTKQIVDTKDVHNKSIKIKTLARLAGLQDNPLSGYGLVIGLAGSGDSRRNKDTTQAIANLLQSFGVQISPSDINSRNTATVIVTASLPPFAHQGDKVDIHVSSLGDARSLLGGTLLVTPLKAPDNQIYALAQGPISLGGFKYDANGNILQKNHPTTGIVAQGAIIEKTLYNDLMDKTNDLHLVLNHPDFTTANRIEEAINKTFGSNTAYALSAQDIEIHPPSSIKKPVVRFISQLENLSILPDKIPTVVINERTGVIIAGADV